MNREVAIGIDIGGTNTAYGLVDREGNLLLDGHQSLDLAHTCPGQPREDDLYDPTAVGPRTARVTPLPAAWARRDLGVQFDWLIVLLTFWCLGGATLDNEWNHITVAEEAKISRQTLYTWVDRGVVAHPQWLQPDLLRVAAVRTRRGEVRLVSFLGLTVGILGVWRVTHLLHTEDPTVPKLRRVLSRTPGHDLTTRFG